jgi:hypothetical protein
MNHTMWVDMDSAAHTQLSTPACSLLLPLWWSMDKNNLVNKKKFIKNCPCEKDQRTWNKYWDELADNKILARVSKDLWMVSPHECYLDGASRAVLTQEWEQVIHG